MERPIRIGDRIDCEQPVFAFRTNIAWKHGGRVFALDGTINDDMCDMDTERPKFTCQTLSYGAQRRFGGGECKKRRTGAKRGGRAREENGAFLAWRKTTDGFAANQKSSQRIQPPQAFEKIGLRFESRRCEVIADVVNDEFEIIFCPGLVEKGGDIRLACRIRCLDYDLAARRVNAGGYRLQARFGAAADKDAQSLPREMPRQSCA